MLYGLLTLIILAFGVLSVHLWRRLQAAQFKAAAIGQELTAVTSVLTDIQEGDQQQASQDLVQGLVASAPARAAILLTLAESGALEPVAAAVAPGDSAWDPHCAAQAKQVLASGAPHVDAVGDLYVPLTVGPEGQGLLYVKGAGTDRPVYQLAAKLGGLTLAGIRLYQKQLALSSTDGLTGLANHRHFQQVLGVALGQAYLQGAPLSIILLDIDHFKQVNDTYGHLLGDLVLREIAYLMRRCVPQGGTTARYGGEEMVILLQGEGAESAPELAEKLRETVADHQFMDFTTGTKLRVTISLGVASYELGQGKSKLINRADEALYVSKREGRNRVTVSPAERVSSAPLPS